MNEKDSFMEQAIQKVQEANEALRILHEHDPDAGYGYNYTALDHVKKALELLNKTQKERAGAEYRRNVEDAQARRLCEKLGIPFPERD